MKNLWLIFCGSLLFAHLAWGQEKKASTMLNFEKDYIFGQIGYGVASISNNSFNIAVSNFNTDNAVNGITSTLEPLSNYSGLTANIGFLNTSYTNDILINLNGSYLNASSQTNLINPANTNTEFKYQQSFYQLNLTALYMPIVNAYIDAGLGVGGELYGLTIKNKISSEALKTFDTYTGYGVVFALNANIFPFSKAKPIMLNLKPYYFADLHSSDFSDINTISQNNKNENSDVTNVGNFSYFGIEIGVGFVIKEY